MKCLKYFCQAEASPFFVPFLLEYPYYLIFNTEPIARRRYDLGDIRKVILCTQQYVVVLHHLMVDGFCLICSLAHYLDSSKFQGMGVNWSTTLNTKICDCPCSGIYLTVIFEVNGGWIRTRKAWKMQRRISLLQKLIKFGIVLLFRMQS